MMIDRLIRFVSPLCLVALLTGCGVELVGDPERDGEVDTVITDPPPSGGSAQSRSSTVGPRFARFASFTHFAYPAHLEQASALLAGSLEAAAAVTLIAENGRLEPLTAGVVAGEVTLASADSVTIGQVEIPVGIYPRVRVAFNRDEAVLSAGFVTDAGLPLEGRIAVDLSAGPIVLEVPLEVEVRRNQRTTIVLNLNSSTWLQLFDPELGLVPAAAFRNAVTVSSQP